MLVFIFVVLTDILIEYDKSVLTKVIAENWKHSDMATVYAMEQANSIDWLLNQFV